MGLGLHRIIVSCHPKPAGGPAYFCNKLLGFVHDREIRFLAPPVFTIFPHYCPIFLYIAHYSHSLPFLLDSFIEARKLFERVKTSRKIIPLPPFTQPYIKSLASLLSLFGTTAKSYAQQKQMKHDSQNGCGFNCSPLTSLLLHFIQFICFIVQDIIHFWGRHTAFGGQAPAIHTNLNPLPAVAPPPPPD